MTILSRLPKPEKLSLFLSGYQYFELKLSTFVCKLPTKWTKKKILKSLCHCTITSMSYLGLLHEFIVSRSLLNLFSNINLYKNPNTFNIMKILKSY